jgi:hypothetical protein
LASSLKQGVTTLRVFMRYGRSARGSVSMKL